MSVKFRDYYKVLGVERSASQDDIRKAFRKLARKYHPDVAEDKAQAEDKFKELNEAYEVLSDPEKREKYDQLGPDWQHMRDFTPPPGGGGGFAGARTGGGASGGGFEYHFDGTGFSDFFEQFFGQRTRGGGFAGYGDMGTASMPHRGRDIEAEILVTLEEVMHGGQRVLTLQRTGIPGETGSAHTIRVRIPKGVEEGQMIRCAGMGEPGNQGGDPGDLFLRVALQRHPDFVITGQDLHHELPIPPWDAVLGGQATIPTPHGRIELKVPAGTANGTELRLRGKGLPKGSGSAHGDLYCKIRLEVPESTTEEAKALWKQLQDLHQS